MVKPRKYWYTGKINPAFVEVATPHSRSCTLCGGIPWNNKSDHYKWREIAQDCMGETLPPSLIDPKKDNKTKIEVPKTNPNNSKIQGNWVNDIITRDKDDEEPTDGKA